MRTSSSAGSLQLFQRSVCSFNIAPPCVCQSANRRNERDKRPKECHENQELWSGKGERKWGKQFGHLSCTAVPVYAWSSCVPWYVDRVCLAEGVCSVTKRGVNFTRCALEKLCLGRRGAAFLFPFAEKPQGNSSWNWVRLCGRADLRKICRHEFRLGCIWGLKRAAWIPMRIPLSCHVLQPPPHVCLHGGSQSWPLTSNAACKRPRVTEAVCLQTQESVEKGQIPQTGDTEERNGANRLQLRSHRKEERLPDQERRREEGVLRRPSRSDAREEEEFVTAELCVLDCHIHQLGSATVSICVCAIESQDTKHRCFHEWRIRGLWYFIKICIKMHMIVAFYLHRRPLFGCCKTYFLFFAA